MTQNLNFNSFDLLFRIKRSKVNTNFNLGHSMKLFRTQTSQNTTVNAKLQNRLTHYNYTRYFKNPHHINSIFMTIYYKFIPQKSQHQKIFPEEIFLFFLACEFIKKIIMFNLYTTPSQWHSGGFHILVFIFTVETDFINFFFFCARKA